MQRFENMSEDQTYSKYMYTYSKHVCLLHSPKCVHFMYIVYFVATLRLSSVCSTIILEECLVSPHPVASVYDGKTIKLT